MADRDLWGHPVPVRDTTLDAPDVSVDLGPTSSVWDRRTGSPPLLHCERHVAWAKRRRRVYDAMLAANVPISRAEAYRTCGASYWVLRHRKDQGVYRLVQDTCNDRFCEPCQRARSKRIQAGLRTQLTADCYRMLTLTIRSTDQPLGEQMSHLMQSFRRLRGTKLWRHCVDGGIAFAEITYNVDRRQWHPHLHCVLSGRWIPAAELSRRWRKATSGSHVIDIKLVRDKMQVATYVSKYATKAYTHRDHYPQHTLIEAIRELRGRRTVVTFGVQAPLKTRPIKSDTEWECVCHANEIRDTDRIDDAHRDELAEWISYVQERRALPTHTILQRPPPDVDDDG